MARRKGIQEKQIQAPHWDNGEVVIIKSLSGPDSEWIQDQLTEVAGSVQSNGKSEQEVNMKMLLGKTQRLTLLRGIVGWTFTDEQNQPLPWPALSSNPASNVAIFKIRDKSLAQVASEDRGYISAAINELSQPMSEEEKKASEMSAENGSLASPELFLIQ